MTDSTAYAVVIPAHNEERFIGDAIASVQGQTVPPAAIIVVDDGSTDGTAVAAAQMGVHVVRQPAALGPSRSRNRAVASTSVPFVAFLDADDIWKPRHAELLLAQLVDHSTVFVGSRFETFGFEQRTPDAAFPDTGSRDIRDLLITTNPIVQSAVMVRRESFVVAGGYDETLRLSEDYDLWNRMAEVGRYCHVDAVTVRRRLHASQATHRFRGELVQAWWGVRVRTIGRRLATALPAEREQVLTLLEQSARDDLEMAIWTGSSAMLGIVRDELQRADAQLNLGGRLIAIAGRQRTARRITQSLRCRMQATRRQLGIGT